MTAEKVRQRFQDLTGDQLDEADVWIEEIRPLLRLAFKAGQRHSTTEQIRNIQAKAEVLTGSRKPKSYSPPSTPVVSKVLPEVPDEFLPIGWRKVMHVFGDEPCRQPALLIKRLVSKTELVGIDLIRRINGQAVQADSPAVCGSCGYELHDPFSRRDLDWLAHTYTVPDSVTQSAVFVEPPEAGSISNASDVVDASSVLDRISMLTQEPVTESVTPEYPIDLQDEDALRSLAQELEVYPDSDHESQRAVE